VSGRIHCIIIFHAWIFIGWFGGKLACMKPLALAVLTILLLSASACVRLISTPLPEPSPDKRSVDLCTAADLQTSSNSSAATGSVILGVTLLNISESPCILRGYPQMTLTANGQALDVQTVQARVGQESSIPMLTIAPGESAIAIAIWNNYCAKAPKSGLGIHIILATGESLDFKTSIQSLPACDASGKPSTLSINPYSYPP
jgi:hypothetical protein